MMILICVTHFLYPTSSLQPLRHCKSLLEAVQLCMKICLYRKQYSTGTVYQKNTKEATTCTLDLFSFRRDGNKQTVPAWYLVGNGRMSIMHARLQMCCVNPVNDHHFSYVHVHPCCSQPGMPVWSYQRKQPAFFYWTACC